MRVRIVKHLPRTLQGVDLERFERNGVYDVTGSVLDLLMVSGCAVEVAEPVAIRKETLKVFADAHIARRNPRTKAFQATHRNGIVTGPVQPDTSLEDLERVRRAARKLVRAGTKQILKSRGETRSTSPATPKQVRARKRRSGR
jgi:hypothetical protein